MKKSLAIVVVTLMLSVLVGGCSTKLEETNALLYKKGLKLIEKMDRKAENEEYIKLMDDSAELQVTISKIGEGNYNSPKGIYKVSFPKGLTSSIHGDSELAKITGDLKIELENRMLAAIPSNINASSGHLYFISSSMLNSFDGFIHEGLIDNTLYIYIYEGDYSVIVSFASGNENIVWSSANFIKTGSLNQISSDSEMLEWLKKYAFITDCKVEKIEQIR